MSQVFGYLSYNSIYFIVIQTRSNLFFQYLSHQMLEKHENGLEKYFNSISVIWPILLNKINSYI